MDIIMLANQVIQALTPLLPFLSGVGAGVGTSMVTKLGEDIYDQSKEQGKHLLEAVKVRVEEEKTVDNGKASKALQNFVEYPDDDDYKSLFRKKLEALLQQDKEFAYSLEKMLQQSPALQQVILLGKNAIAQGNKQTNETDNGEQRIEIGEGGKAIDNVQEIRRASHS